MDISTVKKPLTQYNSTLSQKANIHEIIVFGSYLNGTAHKDSDIDVIVVSSDFASLSEDERLDIVENAARNIRPYIHPWGFTPQELKNAHKFTTLGLARDRGYRFPINHE